MTAATWIILGANSSIARAFAREVAAQGAAVILAGRDHEELERNALDLRIRYQATVTVLDFDAVNTKTHAAFVAQCHSHAQGTMNLFIVFGLLPEQAAMEKNSELAELAIAANYTGAVTVLTHFAPLFEQQAKGHIIVLGSVAGDRGRLSNYVYGSAKAGLHTFLQGLRARLFRAGVSVTTIKPGFIDTSMTFGLPGLFLVASPEDCAKACLNSGIKGRAVAYFPKFWWMIMTIIKHMPDIIFKRLKV